MSVAAHLAPVRANLWANLWAKGQRVDERHGQDYIPCPTCGSNSVVECNLAKVDVASSNLVSRSTCREVSEWLKELAWKAGVGNTTEGSNPSLSATNRSTERI